MGELIHELAACGEVSPEDFTGVSTLVEVQPASRLPFVRVRGSDRRALYKSRAEPEDLRTRSPRTMRASHARRAQVAASVAGLRTDRQIRTCGLRTLAPPGPAVS